ncbi:MAG: HEAT repeat domain-containing protein [Chloroflexi bacterium]|nr:HEAT repeat domain-containing protein [Chloroflexota bacterium]
MPVQAAIIEVLGYFRSSQSIDFLKETLADNNPDIWKPSLDSLVSIGQEALDVLRDSLESEGSNDKMEWIAEAIDQIR